MSKIEVSGLAVENGNYSAKRPTNARPINPERIDPDWLRAGGTCHRIVHQPVGIGSRLQLVNEALGKSDLTCSKVHDFPEGGR